MPQFNFYNLYQRGEDFEPSSEQMRISKAMARRLAKKSHDGGRNECYKCHEFFTTHYGGWHAVGKFKVNEWFCRDCEVELGLYRKRL